jgi:hypothetical protein
MLRPSNSYQFYYPNNVSLMRCCSNIQATDNKVMRSRIGVIYMLDK